MLSDNCMKLEKSQPLKSRDIFEEFDLLSGHPWEETASSELTSYYSCMYGLALSEQPRKILEVGTAFGMSAATFLKASPGVELFVSIDLGIYGQQLAFSQSNIDFARTRIHTWCCKKGIPLERVRFYCANTQPEGKGDNEELGALIPRWHRNTDIVRLLTSTEFDIVFVDGKHTDDGLFNDLLTFWPFLKPGGLLICDDLHDEATYKGIFSWAGQTTHSFEEFLKKKQDDIEDYFVWNCPQVPPGGTLGARPFGLIRKKVRPQPTADAEKFAMFDSEDAFEINNARQVHLASLDLDLFQKSVLEVGSGVGWHTGFFEKLGCTILSTDARPENVMEHRNRYPHRRVEVADLSISNSHREFGEFDVVYCYGTLYHLSDPELCLYNLSSQCKGLFLLETCVNPADNNKINPVTEDSNNPNQSFTGIGCRPGRDWIITTLRKYFPFVYHTVTQPDYPDFATKWPAILPEGVQNARSVFVASRIPLKLPTLSSELLMVQKNLIPILRPDGADMMRCEQPSNNKSAGSVRSTGTASPEASDRKDLRKTDAPDTAVVFPEDDAYWIDTAGFVQKNIAAHETALAPQEFAAKLPEHIIRYDLAAGADTSGLHWAVVHKGMTSEINSALLKHIADNLIPVFANEVFVVFSGRRDLSRVDASSPHLLSFWTNTGLQPKEERGPSGLGASVSVIRRTARLLRKVLGL